jgi:hypothetical protein
MVLGPGPMPSRDENAKTLAECHLNVEDGILFVFRINGAHENDADANEPIKLLEVNANTCPTGIDPIYFNPYTAAGIFYPSVIIEITPKEFEDLKSGKLRLPNRWTIGELLAKRANV